MKNYKLLFSLPYLFCLFLFSCENEKEENLTPNKVYIVNSGVQELIMYNTGNPYSFVLNLYKSGAHLSNASLNITIMSEMELTEYNNENATNYQLLPTKVYEIDTTEVSFSGERTDVNQSITIVFDPAKFSETGNNSYVLPLNIQSASIDINKEKSSCIIVTEIKDPVLSFNESENTKGYLLEEAIDESFSIPVIFDIDNNLWDITAKIEIAREEINEYNEVNQTTYIELPETYYNLLSSVTIPEGEKEGVFTLDLQTSQLPLGEYILPLKLSDISRFKISETDNLFILIIKIVYPGLLNRSGWTIADFNTEEPTGEGEGNGLASCVLDGDSHTFWHSQWNNGSAPDFPHYFVIDMQKKYTLTQIEMLPRQDKQDTKGGEFWISNDMETWTQIGEFILEDNSKDLHSFEVKFIEGQYLKVNFTDSHSNHNSLAEIIPYGY